LLKILFIKLKKHWIKALLITIILLVTATGTILKATSTPKFCSLCHEMAPEVFTWKVTTHSNFACVTCHIPPVPINLIMHKFSSITQLYEHLTGTIPAKITLKETI